MTDRAAAPDRQFREAMASFPSGVTVVTTLDDAGHWWGFTATSFCSVSMIHLSCWSAWPRPPSAARFSGKPGDGTCTSSILTTPSWRSGSAPAASTSSRQGSSPRRAGTPTPVQELHRPVLRRRGPVPGRGHTILLGRVEHTRLDETTPAVYFQSAFPPLSSAATPGRRKKVDG